MDTVRPREGLRLPSTQHWTRQPPPDFAVILDLDNTLVCARLDPRGYSTDFVFDLEDGGQKVPVYVEKRPYLDAFLDALASFASVYLFTAGTSSYAKQVLRYLDPCGTRFCGMFAREDCIEAGPCHYIKPYEKCGTNMAKTMIVDDNPVYFGPYANNGIAVTPFVGQIGDAELPLVLAVVQSRYEAS
jgi:Dullard-like phosphatase family protein